MKGAGCHSIRPLLLVCQAHVRFCGPWGREQTLRDSCAARLRNRKQEGDWEEPVASFVQFSEGVAKRFSGPGGFRLIVQPVVAIALGIRDGLLDAKAGEPAYLIGVILHPERRGVLLGSTVEHILKPFAVGVLIDLVLQYFIFQRVRLVPGIIVGLLLIGLPYSLARGITNRIATELGRRRRN